MKWKYAMNTKTVLLFCKKLSALGLAAVLAACAGSGSSGAVPKGYYRVKSGDTLLSIARKHGQSVQTLAAWNHLRNPSQIEVGQVLRISRNAGTNTAAQRMLEPVNRIKLRWPVENGSMSLIRRFDGADSKGIDIAGVQGQAVKAAADGEVLYVGEEVRSYGKLILISHNRSAITAYAHNDSILVAKGQQVREGQQIATMGSSEADSVRLHFELRLNGKAVNPLPYLVK